MREAKKILVMLIVLCCMIREYAPIDGKAQEMRIVSIEADETSYVFASNGYVKTMHINGVMENGVKIKLEEGVQYLSENESIVSVYQNTIRSEHMGMTGIWAEYNGMTVRIPAVVETEIDMDELEKDLLERAGYIFSEDTDYGQIISQKMVTSRSSRTTQEILDKAVAMKNVEWTPTQDLKGWNYTIDNNRIFKKGVLQKGIPYAQLTQVDEVAFLDKLKNSKDFYINGSTEGGITSPRYGVDCSGYVSFALGISRHWTGAMIDSLKAATGEIVKVGNYNPNSPTKSALYSAYKEMEPGNALVHKGHAILVLSNDIYSEEISVYETTNYLPKISIYSYKTLWNDGNECYMPFKQK